MTIGALRKQRCQAIGASQQQQHGQMLMINSNQQQAQQQPQPLSSDDPVQQADANAASGLWTTHG